MTDFDHATYYDCMESERLEHESVEAAIEAYLDGWAEPDCDMVALIKARSPIEVEAYERQEVSEDWIKSMAEDLFERFQESFAEDFGDPDGDYPDVDKEGLATAVPLLTTALKGIVAHANVWHCDKCGSREYSAEEVEAMMREENPQWFTDTTGKGSA